MPIYDTSSLGAAGLTLTGKAAKYGNAVDQYGNIITTNPLRMNVDYDSVFAIMKQQNMIETLERYMWVQVGYGLTPDLIERLLFFRGKGVYYYNDKIDKFQFLPFALNGVIDEYGRYTSCNTLPFTGVDSTNGKTGKNKKSQPLVYENLPLVYDFPMTEDDFKLIESGKPVGIIINDSSLATSQQPVIRSNYVKPILHMLATLMQIINTAMFGCADHNVIRVDSECELESINQQIEAINFDILKGKRFTPIVDNLQIETLKTNNTANLEGLFNTFNSLTNFLKSITGINNAGVFDKKAQLLQAEQALNGSNADDIYYNGLRMRQEACMLIQAWYQYPIWCESKRGLSEQENEIQFMDETEPSTDTASGVTGGNGNAGTQS